MNRQFPLYWTIIIVLIITLIVSSSLSLATKDTAVAYISFAATITSLVLGVVAIFYSVVTNNQSSENIGVIKKASNDVSEGANKFFGISEGISKVALELKGASDLLVKEINALPVLLKGLDSRIGDIGETQKEIREHLKNREYSLQGKNEVNENVFSREYMEKFLRGNSFNGLKSLLAVKLAFEKHKIFNLNDLFNEVTEFDVSGVSYCFGYLIACGSMGIIQISISDEHEVHVKDVNKHLMELIEDVISRLAAETDKGLNLKEDSDFSWVNSINKIKANFP